MYLYLETVITLKREMSNLISKTDELSEFSITQLTWSLTADVDNEFYAGPRGPVPLSMSITSTENTRPSSTTPAMSCYNSLCCFELSSHSHRAVTVTVTPHTTNVRSITGKMAFAEV